MWTDRQADRHSHGKLIGALLQVSAVNMLKYFQAWLGFQQHYFQYNVDGCYWRTTVFRINEFETEFPPKYQQRADLDFPIKLIYFI
jgi:hypothetical protein